MLQGWPKALSGTKDLVELAITDWVRSSGLDVWGML